MLLNIVIIAISVPPPRPPHSNVDCREKKSCTREVNIAPGGEGEGECVELQRYFESVPRVLARVVVSVNICLVKGNSTGIFVSKVSPGIFVIKVK